MPTLLPNAKQTFTGPNGTPLSGGSVYFYIPGTTTPKNTYQDPAQTILNTNPIVLDANGQAIIWGAGVYRQVVYDANSNLIWDQVTEDTSGGLLGNITDNIFVAGTDFTPGTTTQLTLTAGPGSITNTWIYFDAAYQDDAQVSVNGTTLTFNSPIPVGVGKVTVKIGSTVAIGTPGDGTVTSSKLAPGAVLAAAIQQPATNQIYAQNGAQINRMNDRVFIGAATVNDAKYPTASPDWLSVLQSSTFGENGGAVPFAQLAVLTNNAAGSGITAGAQTKYFTSANAAAIGIQAFGYANNGTYQADAWGYYGESHRLNAGDGSAYGIEIAVVNRGGASVLQTPYAGPLGLSTGIQIDSGNGFNATQEPGLSPASSAMTIVQNTSDNSAPFLRGIVFAANSLQANSGLSEAISFYQGNILQWYCSPGNQTSAIYCTTSAQANSVKMALGDNIVSFMNESSQPLMTINSSNAVNNIAFYPGSSTGAPPIIQAAGTDTNVGILLQMKGTALLQVNNTTLTASATSGSASNLPATPAQYWEVTLNGTNLKIPCYNV